MCARKSSTRSKYSLEIFDPPPVPLSKVIPFDTARRPLSNDISKIVISKTNMDIRFEKLVKQTPKEIFHLPIRFRMCATCEKYSIRLILKRSIDWCIFHLYQETKKSNFSTTLDACHRRMGSAISYTKTCVMSEIHIISPIKPSSIDWDMIYRDRHSFPNIKISKNSSPKDYDERYHLLIHSKMNPNVETYLKR